MKRVDRLSDNQLYVDLADMLTVANQAVKKAKEENQKMGIPDTFSKNGRVYYMLQDGSITQDRPNILAG